MYKQIAQKRYKHGDENEDMPGTLYCAACDIFVEASHLAGDPRDPGHPRQPDDRYLPGRRRRQCSSHVLEAGPDAGQCQNRLHF